MKKFTFLLLFALSLSLHAQQLPYPIIFIHGLNSDSNIWLDTWSNENESTDKIGNFFLAQNLQYGGRIDYCLNDDGNNATSSTIFWPDAGEDIASFTALSSLNIGDFYLVNFDIDPNGILSGMNGFTEFLSNEAAIVKQGVALRDAIGKVLIKTGRDKVIIMGHSMGGLCAREYIQNPNNWQSDGKHHVAKIVTTGTPHKGYYGIDVTIDPIDYINFRSDAYRDLRAAYLVSGQNGVYLSGGIEDPNVMDNNILPFTDFYNLDINCNGAVGENIIGLNERNLPLSLDYSFIIGNCVGCPVQGGFAGDGVVREDSANLGNLYDLPSPQNKFHYSAAAIIQIHTELPLQKRENMQGLDEPNEYNLAYEIVPNKNYKGFITEQPIGGYPYDFDDYKFTLSSAQQTSVLVTNTFSGTLVARFMNSSGVYITGIEISGNSTGTLTASLPYGTFFLEIFSTPNAESYQYPYSFTMATTLSDVDFVENNTLRISPNPTYGNIRIDSISTIQSYEVINALGQTILSAQMKGDEIDMSDLPSGTYLLKTIAEEGINTSKVIKR